VIRDTPSEARRSGSLAEDHSGGFAHSWVPISDRSFEGRFDPGVIERGEGYDATPADLRWPAHDELQEHGDRSIVADRPECSHRRFPNESIFGFHRFCDEPWDRVGAVDLPVGRGHGFDDDGIRIISRPIESAEPAGTGETQHLRRFSANPGLGIGREDVADRRNELVSLFRTRRQCKPPQVGIGMIEERNRIP
jgi:hypothetical protein